MPESTEIARFADVAMFKAEPLRGADGPSVAVLAMNPDPLGSIAATALMYKGVVVRDLAEVTDEQRVEMFHQISNTKLKAPFEFVKIHMLLENVHRGLTHQLVRQRTAVYAQESMRFAVKDGLAAATHLPPSLQRFNNPEVVRDLDERIGDAEDNQIVAKISDQEQQFLIWRSTARAIEDGYEFLINKGMPAEEARGLTPTNIGTRVHYATDLRALSDHAGNRLCTQAQFEWRQLWLRIIPAIRAFGGRSSYRVDDSVERGLPRGSSVVTRSSQWQFDHIASMFRPVCYLTGKCEFAAMDLDRACKIRDRVDAFARHGVPSDRWGYPTPIVEGVALHPEEIDEDTHVDEWIERIEVSEWLADPSAARVRR